LIALALGMMLAACLDAKFRPIGGMGGDTSVGTGGRTGAGGTIGTGGMIGIGGDPDTGVGGSGAAGGVGVGGSGAGGVGIGGSGTGGSGTGGSGTGGAMIDGGSDAAPAPSAPGQLVITEIMADSVGPPDESGEWFELYNPTNQTFDLFGCLLFDTSTVMENTDTVGRHILIDPQHYVTMARFGDVSGGFSPTYNYHTRLTVGGIPDPDKDVKFDNAGDRVGITCGSTVIDTVEFSAQSAGWIQPIPPATVAMVPHGRSYSLDPSHLSATENEDPANWCTGVAVYPLPSGPDHGTPGVANPPCACPGGTLLSCPWTTP
jgi:hypothetical protein